MSVMICAARAGANKVPGMLGSGAGAMTGGRALSVLWTNFLRMVRRQKISDLMTSNSSWCSSPISCQSSGLARTASGMMVRSTRILRFLGKRSALVRRVFAAFDFSSSGADVAPPGSGGGPGFPSRSSSNSSWSWAGSRFSELLPKSRCWRPAMILSLRASSALRRMFSSWRPASSFSIESNRASFFSISPRRRRRLRRSGGVPFSTGNGVANGVPITC